MTAETIVTIVVALLGSGALTAVLTPLVNRRQNRANQIKAEHEAEKARAEGAKVLTDAAVGLLKPLQDQIDDATAKIARLSVDLTESRQKLSTLTIYVDTLIKVIREAGLPVPPHPEGEGG